MVKADNALSGTGHMPHSQGYALGWAEVQGMMCGVYRNVFYSNPRTSHKGFSQIYPMQSTDFGAMTGFFAKSMPK